MSAASIRFDQHRQADAKPVFSECLFGESGGPANSGFWASEPGCIEVAFNQDQFEFCSILEGQVRLTDSQGRVELYNAGDAFIMPGGFKGTWETVQPVRKFYVICDLQG
ncbi:cupin domain-containing protein [Pseudomonas silvicola]|nr:cupin domain-containing protein [Pseudomonas silvicola]